MAYNNYMGSYDDLVTFDNKLKTHQRHLQFLVIKTHKSKTKRNPSFMWKNSPIITKKGHFRLNSKRKHSEIWNKFFQFQRKGGKEQPTNKV